MCVYIISINMFIFIILYLKNERSFLPPFNRYGCELSNAIETTFQKTIRFLNLEHVKR